MSGGQLVVIGAVDSGYGPATKAAVIADQLTALDVRVARDRGLAGSAERFLSARPALAQRASITDGALVVSVMDPELCRRAQRAGTPYVWVDSLWWLRAAPHPALRDARCVIAQRWPGIETCPAQEERAATLVGPVLPPAADPGGHTLGRVLQVGGWPDDLTQVQGPVTRLGGDVGMEEAERLLAGASLAITRPGPTATLQLCRARTPLVFLPPRMTGRSQPLVRALFRDRGMDAASATGARHAFFASLGGDGGREVAEILAGML